MKTQRIRLLALALSLSLLGGFSVSAADEIWIEPPTGWRNWGHVYYETRTVGDKTYVLNWGVRGEQCRFLSSRAKAFYPDLYNGQGVDWCYDLPDLYQGGTGPADATSSTLYAYLHDFLAGKQTHTTSYAETRDLYRYTDCMANNCDYISSFYSGRKLNGAWDGGSTWNREHTWPKSKSTGSQEADIMMLRPTSVQENSDRGNQAYGESTGFYNPNAEANGEFDLRGDCARICLYCYVRWSENAENMWGQAGVIESLDVLLSWMEQDPVDTWEMGRNDAVESITGVRNCFVDYPELAWMLFGRQMPEDYDTPCICDSNYFVSVPAYLEARPDDAAHGSVEVRGWAVECFPAEGYYASGYDLYIYGGEIHMDFPFTGLFRWEHGRLLYYPETEQDFLVEIHFTPVGQEDPCPTGHDLDLEHAEILEAPTCTENGRGLAKCTRCGAGKEIVLKYLWHDWDEGVVTKPATIDEWGIRQYTCTRCGETWEEDFHFEFDDVKDPSKYYYNAVYWALFSDPRITAGVDGTHFAPKKTCSRAEVVTFLWRAMGEPEPSSETHPFVDVKENAYYRKAVLWAVEHGVTTGTDATHFSPKKVCSRAEVVTFLWKAAGQPEPFDDECPFTDVTPGKYYYKAMLWALENGITNGVDETHFAPKQNCTRGQAVRFLHIAFSSPVIDFPLQ